MAVNAQTDIARYEHNGLFYQLMFDGLAEDEVATTFGARLSTVANVARFSDNSLFLVQNIQDKHHYQEHFLPFCSAVSGVPVQGLPEGIHRVADSPVTAWVYSHPDGHMPETPEMAEGILNLIGASLG